MLHKIFLCLTFFSVLSATAQDINAYLGKYEIDPTMISQHPDGEWFMSTQSNKASKPQLLKLTPLTALEAKIDTLDYGFYLNISKLSNDGDHLLYAFADTVQGVRKTYMRKYENGKLGEATDFRALTGLESLTYFMLDADENVYFYSYTKNPKGLYKILKNKDGTYSEAELLLPNRPNFVPFSPLFLDDKTMLVAQHGVDDKSVNGIYVSKMENDKWQTPIKIKNWPYGWSLGYDKDGNIIYINAGTKKIESYNRKIVMKAIETAISKS